MQRVKKMLPWLLGILFATLLFAVLAGYTTFDYSGTDDAPILRAFMGYEGGEPAHYSMLVHTVMAWVLWGLAKLFPGIAWFSIFQLLFLWFSSVVVVKSFSRCAVLHHRPIWVGALAGVMAMLAGALFISCRVSFTTTAAWLGAAAVAQLASVDWVNGTGRAIRRGMGLSTLLLVLCYFLRQVSVLPPLAFWLLGIGLMALTLRVKGQPMPWLKPMLTGAAVCLSCLLVLTGIRVAETKLLQLDEFYAWQDSSSQLLDYSDMDSTPPTDEALAEIGWSRDEYTLFTYWYFMDDNINPQTMDRLYQSTFRTAVQSVPEHLNAAAATVAGVAAKYPTQTWATALGLLAAALALVITLFLRPRKVWLWLGALATPLLALLLLGYLGWEGRLPMRAMLSVTLPMITLAFWVLLTSLEPVAHAPVRNTLALVVCLALIYPAYQSTALGWYDAQPPVVNEDTEQTPIVEDLDSYAIENPDTLFIYDLSLVCDNRMFPNTAQGISGNVMFWGGHPARSISWYGMLAKYGITELNASLFLRDNVLIATTDPEPWPSMMGYIAEETGQSVDWEYADTYGYLNFFRIYVY